MTSTNRHTHELHRATIFLRLFSTQHPLHATHQLQPSNPDIITSIPSQRPSPPHPAPHPPRSPAAAHYLEEAADPDRDPDCDPDRDPACDPDWDHTAEGTGVGEAPRGVLPARPSSEASAGSAGQGPGLTDGETAAPSPGEALSCESRRSGESAEVRSLRRGGVRSL